MTLDDQPTVSPVVPQTVARRMLRRYGPAVLLIWLAVTASIIAIARPPWGPQRYEATAWLIVRTAAPKIFDQNPNQGDQSRYMKTQVELVTSSDVLGATMAAHPELAKLPSMVGKVDVEAEIRQLLEVKIAPDTNLITVSLSSWDREEAREIIDAVVEAYLVAARNWSLDESQDQIKRLVEESRKLQAQIDTKKQRLRSLVTRLAIGSTGGTGNELPMSADRRDAWLKRFDSIKLRRMELESQLKTAKDRSEQAGTEGPQPASKDDIAQAFFSRSEVAALLREKKTVQSKLETSHNEPDEDNRAAEGQAKNRLKEIDQEIDELWRKKAPELGRNLLAASRASEGARAISELEAEVTAAKNLETTVKEALIGMKNDFSLMEHDPIEVQLTKEELDADRRLMVSMQNRINQIEYDSKGAARVDRANVRTRVDPRNTGPSLAQVAVLSGLVLLGLVVLCAFIETVARQIARKMVHHDTPELQTA